MLLLSFAQRSKSVCCICIAHPSLFRIPALNFTSNRLNFTALYNLTKIRRTFYINVIVTIFCRLCTFQKVEKCFFSIAKFSNVVHFAIFMENINFFLLALRACSIRYLSIGSLIICYIYFLLISKISPNALTRFSNGLQNIQCCNSIVLITIDIAIAIAVCWNSCQSKFIQSTSLSVIGILTCYGFRSLFEPCIYGSSFRICVELSAYFIAFSSFPILRNISVLNRLSQLGINQALLSCIIVLCRTCASIGSTIKCKLPVISGRCDHIPLTVNNIHILYPAFTDIEVLISMVGLALLVRACIFYQAQVNLVARGKVIILCRYDSAFIFIVFIVTIHLEVQIIVRLGTCKSHTCGGGSHQSCQRQSGQSFCFHSSSSLG